MTLLTFGKHKNELLELQPESYIKWLATHKNVLSVEHRYISDIAKNILAAREQTTSQAAIVAALNEYEAAREARLAVLAAEQVVRASQSHSSYTLHNARAFNLLR